MSLLQALKLSPPPVEAASADKFSQAAETWRQTHRQADERITALKAAIKTQCAGGHPAFLQEIEKGLLKLDDVLNTVDHRLADSLASAGKAMDDAARAAELKSAKALLAEYIGYVKSAPLVAHTDRNPFGVKTDLKGLLAGGLSQAAKAIG